MKTCSNPQCDTPPAEQEFTKSRATKDGLSYRCKGCEAAYRRDNATLLRARQERYCKANAEVLRKKARDRQALDPVAHAKRARAWQDENPNRVKSNRRRRYKERYETDPAYRLRLALRRRLVHALSKDFKAGSAVRDLGCTIPELKTHLEKQFAEGMNWGNWSPTGWHIDHIQPLASFDLTNREQFLQACHYTNLQPLWATDNLTKRDRLDWEKAA